MERKEDKRKKVEFEELKTKKERMDRVNKFKDKVLEKYKDKIKCIVVMGSVVRDEFKPKSDIDIFIVADDTDKPMPFDEKQKMDGDILKIAKDISPNLSFQPLYTLTEFMDYARIGHPIIYNFIKEGHAVFDVGFFTPFQRLLKQGRIPMTREAIETYMDGAPKKLMRAKTVKLLMLAEDCFYAMLNSAQAVLMFMGVEPPVPNKAYAAVNKYLVEPGILEPEYAEQLREIIEIRKKIEHKELMDTTGQFVDEWIDKADKFINKMYDLLTVLEEKKKVKVLERTHEVMRKAATAALKSVNKLPKKDEEVPQAFKKEFVDSEKVEKHYWDVWKKIDIMKDLADRKRSDKIPEKDVYRMREYVRSMIRDLSKVLKDEEKK
ncbi:MAG: nucleotidyltransferase domain-containing protein [Candidatus Aenigmarchaeota archaeon]|nr:nucleotidyltransferase domain-containing protein [Candidatus Aenigmarchaeota archaeon]